MLETLLTTLKRIVLFPFVPTQEVVMNKCLFLKVKLKSLMAEARIIRKEERKLLPPPLPRPPKQGCPSEELVQYHLDKATARARRAAWKYDHEKREALYFHRIRDVRDEARATLLAYGFLRGRKYRQMEARTRGLGEPTWGRVMKMVEKYGGKSPEEAFKAIEAWKKVK
jgi:hypothetical protein